jgi:hypothetical protein
VAADSGSRLNEDPEHGGCAERACFEKTKKKSGEKSPHSKRATQPREAGKLDSG